MKANVTGEEGEIKWISETESAKFELIADPGNNTLKSALDY